MDGDVVEDMRSLANERRLTPERRPIEIVLQPGRDPGEMIRRPGIGNRLNEHAWQQFLLAMAHQLTRQEFEQVPVNRQPVPAVRKMLDEAIQIDRGPTRPFVTLLL